MGRDEIAEQARRGGGQAPDEKQPRRSKRWRRRRNPSIGEAVWRESERRLGKETRKEPIDRRLGKETRKEPIEPRGRLVTLLFFLINYLNTH
jgi:hypothetical protein